MQRSLFTSLVLLLAPFVAARAEAQPSDGLEINIVPYFWAAALDGEMTAGPRTLPLFLSFSDAADKLAGAASFHAEVIDGRWGVLADLNFIRLKSTSAF